MHEPTPPATMHESDTAPGHLPDAGSPPEPVAAEAPPEGMALLTAQFARWRNALEDSLENFITTFSPQITGKLDFSAASLSVLEAWLLSHYAQAADLEQEGTLTGKIAIYVGEVFRRQLGGEWTVLMDPPDAAHQHQRDLRGIPLMNCPPACCPRQLVVQAVRKRNSFTLRACFEYFKKRREREARAAAAVRAAATGTVGSVSEGDPT